LPAISVLSLNILGKMSFAALSGFDSMAIFAGEARNAVKTIAWSVIIAAPIIALMFMMGTSSVVALVPRDKIDLVMPISQALSLGTRPGELGASLMPLVLVALLYSLVASQVLTFGLTSRLPLVAGWDNLLPAWFGRLHPRHRTPANSILFVGVAAFAVAISAVAGSGQQEAFQLLQNTGALFYAIAYMIMFALPLAGKQRSVARPPLWLQAAAVSGFIMTAIYFVLAVFPIIDVPSPWIFTAKAGGFVLACQLGGAALFWSYHRRARHPGR
jgi:amino acid transporter